MGARSDSFYVTALARPVQHAGVDLACRSPPMGRSLAVMATAPAAPKGKSFDRSIVEGPIIGAVWKIAWPTVDRKSVV